MLTQTNLAGIRASLKQWSQRKNIPDDVLNDMIELALSKANRALRIPPLEAFVKLPVDENGYFAIPENFIEVKNVIVVLNNKEIPLTRKSISEVNANASDTIGQPPCIYGRFGDTFRIAPYGAVTEVGMYYYYAIPQMSGDSSTNWFTQHAPEILLYGALAELASYTRDQEGEQRWNGKFMEAVGILQGMEEKAAWWSGDPLAISLGGSR